MTGVTILTDIPSPYQVELLGALVLSSSYPVKVIFCRQVGASRSWDAPEIPFEHCFLDRGGLQVATTWVRLSDLVVFGGYASFAVQRLMWLRVRTGLPWALWGERPGANLRTAVGRIVRVAMQAPIRLNKVPIWGIGEWAVEGYRSEIGSDRLLINVPYYSDLSPFLEVDRERLRPPKAVRFLFSGSLIERKGVDVLATVFDTLAAEEADVHLTFLGAGPLEGQLRRMTNRLERRVRFVGFKQWNELPDVYSQHDVLCVPSRYDGWGLVVPEGQAAGMPVIASDHVGSARELISQRNGWIVRAGDTDTLLVAMRSAVKQSPSERRNMLEDARTTARRLNIDAGVKRLQDAIAGTLSACAALGLGLQARS